MYLGHTRLLFKVSHLGFSTYIAPFTDLSATLHFNPENPSMMTAEASIKTASVQTHYPDPTGNFNAIVTGALTFWVRRNSRQSPLPPPT